MQLGNYDVVKRIRVGGMGAVYEGRQRSAFGRRVAIKVILGNYAADREMRRRFAIEARTIAELHHPHVLPLIEFGDEQGILYLVMPFIEGGTLTGYLRRSLPDFQDVATIFLQLLDAVEYAHEQGLIHRDIKSSNVLLEVRRDGPPYVYLADFGLVRYSEHPDREVTGKPLPLDQIPGTPHYMAPEQTRGIITKASDIYALGVLLYQMLIGELPYDDPDDVKIVRMHLYAPVPSPCDHDASIPVDLGEIVQKAMAKRVDGRFGSVAEMREAFIAAIEKPLPTVEFDEDQWDDNEYMQVDLSRRRASIPLSSMELKEAEPKSGYLPPQVKKTYRRNNNRNHKHLTLSLVATTLVSLILLVLLLMPRVFNVSLFPIGFPVFGNSPYATVSVFAQSKMVQDTYLLTASPQVLKPDLIKRVIPDREVSSTATASNTVASTGIKMIPGAQANGLVEFDNSGRREFSIPNGYVLTTNSGIAIKLMQSVLVPASSDGQSGTTSAPAMAVLQGVTGNIAANALDTQCCNNHVLVRNPQPFSGGVDPHFVHIVSQSDIDGVKNALSAQLQEQAKAQIQKQIAHNEEEAGPFTYTEKVVADSNPGTQANEVNVRVSVSANIFVYNQTTARLVVIQLLNKEAQTQLGIHYSLKDVPTIGNPVVVQQGQTGIVYLSVAASGMWIYTFSSQQISQWQQSIKSASPMLAATFLEAQHGVKNAQIRLPFGADHLPTAVDQIKIVVVNG
jgi:serine/threonine protein kinase